MPVFQRQTLGKCHGGVDFGLHCSVAFVWLPFISHWMKVLNDWYISLQIYKKRFSLLPNVFH